MPDVAKFPGKPRRGVSDRTLLIWFSVGVAFILLLTGGVLLNRSVWSKRVEAKIAELADAGYPVSIEDLKRRDQQGTRRENAADIYEKAFVATRTKTGFGQGLLPIFGYVELEPNEPLPPGVAEETGRFLAQNSGAIDLFQKASQVPECRFSPTFTPDGDVLVEYVGPLRGGARLLALKVILAGHEGRSEEAAEAAAAIFRLSAHLQDERFLISALTRVAIAGIGFTHLPWVLNNEVSEESLARLQAAIASTEDEFLLAAILPTEIAGGIHYSRMRFPEETGASGDWKNLIGSGLMTAYQVVGQADRDLFHYLERMEEAIENAQVPLAQRNLPNSSYTPPSWRTLVEGGLFLDEWLPDLDRMFEVEKKAVANARAGLVSVAASRYRLRYGRFPQAPSDLLADFLEPAQILDPFTGAALEYFVDEEGFTVAVEGEVIIEVKR